MLHEKGKQRVAVMQIAVLTYVVLGMASSCFAAPLATTSGSLVYGKRGEPITITFVPETNRFGRPNWGIVVGDPYKYLPEGQNNRDMGDAISLCSRSEYLRLLDRSLTEFYSAHPGAQIIDMTLGTYTVRELWQEIRADMRTKLSRVPGKKITMHDPKNDNLNEPPAATWTAPNRVLQRSETIAATRRIFLKHGFQVGNVSLGTEFWFKESLNGRTWAKISALPDVGIASPGTIEFVIRSPARISHKGQTTNTRS